MQEYSLKLLTLSPVHIGDGSTYSQKDYIYENGYFYFPDIGQLYNYLLSLNRKTAHNFESFLMSQKGHKRNERLVDFLTKEGISNRGFSGFEIKETGFEVENKRQAGTISDVNAFIKNAFGQPYIPGSSLKGALRTILVNQHFKKDKISWGSGRQGEAADDIFHEIRVADSPPIDTDRLILTRKWDYSCYKTEGEKNPHSINLIRESIRPVTFINVKVTAHSERAIELIDQLPLYTKAHYKHYVNKFLHQLPEKFQQTQTLNDQVLYLGAGSGFWTKTYIDKADPSRHRRGGKTRMRGDGVHKLTKASSPVKEKNKKTGETINYNLINNEDNLYEMGKCIIYKLNKV